jgi:hypothetical protein
VHSEAEIRRITVQSQPRQIVCEILSRKSITKSLALSFHGAYSLKGSLDIFMDFSKSYEVKFLDGTFKTACDPCWIPWFLYLIKRNNLWSWGYDSVVEYLPSMHKALVSIPSISINK